MNQIKSETNALAKYVKTFAEITEENFDKVKTAILNMDLIIENYQQDILSLRESHEKLKDESEMIKHGLSEVREMTKYVCKVADSNEEKIRDTQSKVRDQETVIASTVSSVAALKENMEQFERNFSHTRPSDKPFFYPPDRLKTFVGRENELELLESNFLNKEEETFTQVVCGLGGIGKTTLSVEFSWRCVNFYKGGVFWMSADSGEMLDNSIQRLAIDVNTTGSTSQETLLKTLRWLSLIQSRWLLVIDNVDEQELTGNIREVLLGAWKRGSKGHILVTSRREAADAEEAFQTRADACVTLHVLTTVESMHFMRARSDRNDVAENDILEDLVNELGCLPLALEQAAAHIKSLKCTFEQYLDKFRKKKLKLLRVSKAKNSVISMERLSVQTTWQLNFNYITKQSEENDLGNAAVNFMNIASFFFPDDIPLELINVGLPQVFFEDLKESLEDDLGQRQIVEILTQFSLFQRRDDTSISVHRLVQEVVREHITDKDQITILQSASRMIHYALECCTSPSDVLKATDVRRGSLRMWSRLASHANAVKSYILPLSERNAQCKNDCYLTVEMSKLLQTCSIYHSLFQRQNEALASQAQMVNIVTTLSLSENVARHLTSIKVPLLSTDRLLLENGTASAVDSTETSDTEEKSLAPVLVSKELRQKGNDEFEAKQYQKAIQYYTEALRLSAQNPDPRVLSNRSLCHLRNCAFEECIKDADWCIKIDPKYYKAYCWKAYAIANLIRLGQLPENWESVGLAAASVAGFLDTKCLLEYKMKIEYPLVRYKKIEDPSDLGRNISSLLNMSFTTLLLKKGQYNIEPMDFTTKSIQVIGIESGVEIVAKSGFRFFRPSSSIFTVKYSVEETIHVHFENVTFGACSGQLSVMEHVTATFSRCRFSNGKRSCKNFPLCDGVDGCQNPDKNKCKKRYEYTKSHHSVSGESGHAGIVAENGGKVYLDNCIIDSCGGGGTLCDGDGSFMEIKECTIKNMPQMGVEARNGGKVIVTNCTICDNHFHGVAIGPRGFGEILRNSIQNNKEEGIWSGGILDQNRDTLIGTTCPDAGSCCLISDNVIKKNGMSGISLDGGNFEVAGNRIFDNWLWGLMAKSRSTASICNNDIFENKCGGIRIGINYSATILIDGNTVKDHSGPAVYAVETEQAEQMIKTLGERYTDKAHSNLEKQGKIRDEATIFNRPPYLTTRNVFRDNAKGTRHPKEMLELTDTCCNCRKSSDALKKCSSCYKAAYCSRACQKEHWKQHKYLCDLINKEYTIKIDMRETKKNMNFQNIPSAHMLKMRFTGPLPGIGEGTPPSRKSRRQFIVKIQSGYEYTRYDPNKEMSLYDQSLGLDIFLTNPKLYHMVNECGELASTKFTTKKIFCWASFKDNGLTLCIHTDNLPAFQTW